MAQRDSDKDGCGRLVRLCCHAARTIINTRQHGVRAQRARSGAAVSPLASAGDVRHGGGARDDHWDTQFLNTELEVTGLANTAVTAIIHKGCTGGDPVHQSSGGKCNRTNRIILSGRRGPTLQTPGANSSATNT